MPEIVSRFIIYGLIDPRTSELRYVGRSSNGLDRPRWHWRRKRLREGRDHCHSWVRSILKDGLEPEICVIEELNDSSLLNDAERFWIASFRSVGANLVNMTDGGEGTTGVPPWIKGKHHSLETREKMSKAQKGRPGRKGGTISEAQKEKIRESNRNRIWTAEARSKISVWSSQKIPWNKGKIRTSEMRAKYSEAKKRYWEERRAHE